MEHLSNFLASKWLFCKSKNTNLRKQSWKRAICYQSLICKFKTRLVWSLFCLYRKREFVFDSLKSRYFRPNNCIPVTTLHSSQKYKKSPVFAIGCVPFYAFKLRLCNFIEDLETSNTVVPWSSSLQNLAVLLRVAGVD